MADLTLGNVESRKRVYNGLRRRNLVVWVLRFAVPIFGVLVLAVLLVQIIIANIAEGLGAAGITLDRDQLTISLPNFRGQMDNGGSYAVNAEKATALLTNTDMIEMAQATLRINRVDGSFLVARAQTAFYNVANGTVDVPGLLRIRDSDGTFARLSKTFVDWDEQVITTTGGANIEFSDGSLLTSKGLIYYAGTAVWDFERAELITNRPVEDAGKESDKGSGETGE